MWQKTALKQKRGDQKNQNVAHCGSPCVRIEGGYDSLHPLDQWLGFGENPSPDTETTAYKWPSVSFIFTANVTLCCPKRSQHAALHGGNHTTEGQVCLRKPGMPAPLLWKYIFYRDSHEITTAQMLDTHEGDISDL